ncbi:lon [Symbiodinium microadriaticum]|nr:lon [Symbiodinium microadriaticum]
MSTSSPDYSMTRLYVETLLDIPWGKEIHTTKFGNDGRGGYAASIDAAKSVLDAHHCGMALVKKRILEFIAVQCLEAHAAASAVAAEHKDINRQEEQQISRVGKTSLGNSISRALGRKFERIALGGVNNEVIFIATANRAEHISSPLLDRMELLTLSGYSLQEKQHIASLYLLPKQTEGSFLELGKDIQVLPSAIVEVICGYTREAGVRQLEMRYLGTETVSLCDGTIGSIHVTGSLGEVMKESCHIALSWLRSNSAMILSKAA